jgi:hypothetical protein
MRCKARVLEHTPRVAANRKGATSFHIMVFIQRILIWMLRNCAFILYISRLDHSLHKQFLIQQF